MVAKAKLKNRRPRISVEEGPFVMTVGFDPDTGYPCEVFMVSRGKVGQDLDHILYELCVKASAVMQGKL